ncbi:MAG: HEAT repeat domain-containing protein [Planctomycetota bacterium]|jgi:hypothetical protein
MGIKLAWLVAGATAGVVVTLLVKSAVGPEPSTLRAPPPDRTDALRLAELEQENEKLRTEAGTLRQRAAQLVARVAEQEEQLKTAEECGPMPKEADQPEHRPEAHATPTDKEIQAELHAFGQALLRIIQGGGEEAKKRVREFLARGGEPVIHKLVETFRDETAGIDQRAIVAHALAQSGDPDALEALKGALRDPDAGMLMHRLASHGLAFSDAEGLETVLSLTAHKAEDLGARANAAFGLARRGTAEGIPLYMAITDEAIEKGDPAGLQYLGGVTLLGEKAYPAMRERLLTYTETQALLLLIEVLKARGDKGAIPNLEKLAYDSTRPVSVQKSAEAALELLRRSAN